ncbi:MAG: hypothetical protein VX154_09155 [Pseudomonadota bacterium]|nr:hypothetical protein [Pseudomonadota bacterium]
MQQFPQTTAVIDSLKTILLPHPINCEVSLRLHNAGWKPLKSVGVFSDIYLSNCEQFILRLGHDDDKSLKDSYPYHAQNCIQHPNNPYFQKMYWHCYHSQHQTGKIDKSMNISLMEPLQPVAENSPAAEEREYVKLSLRCRYEYIDYNPDDLPPPNPLLHRTVQLLKATAEKHNLLYDMQNDNFMMRSDGHLVILDPFQ